jgi:O-antigen ligase
MTTLESSLKTTTSQRTWLLTKGKDILIGVAVIGLGVLLAWPFRSVGTAQLAISILVDLALMVVIAHKPLNGLLIWLVVAPFTETWINIPMGAGIPDLEFSRFIVAFVAIFMLARAAIGKFRFARISLTDVCIVATTIGIMISAPLADRPKSVVQTAVSMHFVTLVTYFYAKNLVRSRDDLHKLLLAIVTFGLAAALYAIYEHTTGNILFLPEGELAATLDTTYTEHLRLLQGLLGRSSHFGRVLAGTIPTTFYLFFEGKEAKRKVCLVGMLVVQAYGMFLTYNRTSWYTLMIGLSILPFFYPQFRKVYFLIVFVAAVVLWATWDQVNESAVVQERVNSKVSTLEGREVRWQAGYSMWLAKPIRGWGFGRYQQESGHFRTDGESKNIRAIENDYLHILVASGLIGFAPYLLFLLVPLVNSARLFIRARASDWSGFVKPEAIAIYWAVISAFIIGSYTQIQTKMPVKIIPFAVAGAVVGSHEYLLRRSNGKT